MKKVILFSILGGIALAVVILSWVAYFLFSPGPSGSTSTPVTLNMPAGVGQMGSDAMMTLEFGFNALPPLDKILREHPGMPLRVLIFSAVPGEPIRWVPIRGVQATPDFSSVKVDVFVSDMRRKQGTGPKSFWVMADTCYSSPAGSNGAFCSEGTQLEAKAAFEVPTETMVEKATVRIQRTYFTRNYTHKAGPCSVPSDRKLLTGKIVATDEFLQRLPKGKKVVAVAVQDSVAVMAANLSNVVYSPDHNSEPFTVAPVDASKLKDGAEFSIAASENSDLLGSVLYMDAVLCDEQEDSRACAERKLPGPSFPTDRNQEVFRLVRKDFLVSYCGDRNAFFYLHWLPIYQFGAEPVQIRTRKPGYPPELIEQSVF